MAKKKVEKKAHEVFEIKEGRKTKVIEKDVEIEEKVDPKKQKKQIQNENKLLRNILITLGFIVVLVIFIVFFIKSVRTFEYNGVDFEVVREGDLILYQTSIPVIYQGEKRDYNFYLRNDPRKLDVPFDGDLNLLENGVLNMEQDFNCGGYGIIAIANLAKLYQIAGVNLITDENATCDSQGRYMYITIKEGEETKVDKVGPSCYDIYINNCEILEGTEKFMVETFVQINKAL